VTDDGIGLPDVSRSTGVGLASIRNRAARLGGVALVARGPAGGTSVAVTCARTDRSAAELSA
jgi:signal transduction histidine kinase